MGQPDIAEKPVIPLLVQDKLAVAAKTGVHFAVAVQVRGPVPGTVAIMEVENGTFADVDKQTDILATSRVY